MSRFKNILTGSIVAVLMFTMMVPPASAATTAELQAMIATLMAQIAALNEVRSAPELPKDTDKTSVIVSGQNGEIGEFEITFELTAFRDTMFIKNDVQNEKKGNETSGFAYSFTGDDSSSVTKSISSSAPKDKNGVFKITQGETESFIIRVVVQNKFPAQTRVGLTKINYSTEPTGTKNVKTELFLPPADYQTPYAFLNGSESTDKKLTVTVPNGGEQWQIGVTNTVTWSPYSYNPDVNPAKDVTAYLEVKNSDGSFRTLGKVQESGKASIHWPTGELNSLTGGGTYAPAGNGYYIRVVNNVTGATDRSDKPFTLLPKPVDLKINGSDGPVKVASNEQVVATWNAIGGVTRCELQNAYKDISRKTEVGSVALTGKMEVYLHADPLWGPTLYCFKTDGTSVYDGVKRLAPEVTSDIKIKVVSPNGGEKLNPTKSVSVKYVADGISTISVGLYKNEKWLAWITKDLNVQTNPKPEIQFIPNAIAKGLGQGDNTGDIFKIYITGQKANGSGYTDDKSDTTFSFIVSTTSTPVSAKPTPRFNGMGGGATPTITISAVFGKPVAGIPVVTTPVKTSPVKLGTVTWGDGVTETVSGLVTGDQTTVNLKHTYKRSGTYKVVLTNLTAKSVSELVTVVVPPVMLPKPAAPATSTSTPTPTVKGASIDVLSDIGSTLQTISRILATMEVK